MSRLGQNTPPGFFFLNLYLSSSLTDVKIHTAEMTSTLFFFFLLPKNTLFAGSSSSRLRTEHNFFFKSKH